MEKMAGKEVDHRSARIRVLKAEEESREVKVVVAEEGGFEYGIVSKKSPGNQGQDQGETLSFFLSFSLSRFSF